MNGRILILVDYRGFFYGSTVNRYWSFDLPRLRAEFAALGWEAEVKGFPDVDLRGRDYTGQFVVYQSSEDPDLLYKSYIEDVLLGLREAGAVLLPEFKFFRAHHNKVFMEILRDTCAAPQARSIRSRLFGTMEDALAAMDGIPLPAVVKPAAGDSSTGVSLARTRGELVEAFRAVSGSAGPWRRLRRTAATRGRRLLKRSCSPRESLFRRKFVVQEFVPGLENDFKVLVYGDRFYVLERKVRPKDFRASGSGLFSWPAAPPDGLLDFCREIFEAFEVPFVSLDVAHDGRTWHMLECQFVLFGNLTAEGAKHCFSHSEAGWVRQEASPVIEREFARSTVGFSNAYGSAPWRRIGRPALGTPGQTMGRECIEDSATS